MMFVNEDFNHMKFWCTCACATIMYRLHYAVYWDWFSQIEPVPVLIPLFLFTAHAVYWDCLSQIEPVPVPIPLFLFTRQYYYFLLVELSIVYLQSLKFS